MEEVISNEKTLCELNSKSFKELSKKKLNKKCNSNEYNLNEDKSINKEIEVIITNIENELNSNEQNKYLKK